MLNGFQRYRRVILSVLWIAVYVGVSYAVYALHKQPTWIRTVVGLAQVGALLLAFFTLSKSRGLYANLLRGLVVIGGLFFSSLLILYGRYDFIPASLWYADMPQWGGWLVGLAIVSWLPARTLSPRTLARQGWQSDWFAWTSLALALGLLFAITRGGEAWMSVVASHAKQSVSMGIAYELAPVAAAIGLVTCAAILLYVRWMPTLLRGRALLWLVVLILGAALIALPVVVNDEGLAMGLRRFANRVLYAWESAPMIGCVAFFSAFLGLWPRRIRPERELGPTELSS